jgi:LacI family transcriptional regulator
VRGPKALSSSKARWRGVQRFARDSRLDLDPKLVVDLPDQINLNAGVDDAFRITEELLKQKKSFTALMAYDDMTAFGALRALTKAGIKVPQECSIIGFDDVNPSHLMVPALTTVRQPMDAMGASAVSILLDGISSAAENRTVSAIHRKLPAELVIRETTQSIS